MQQMVEIDLADVTLSLAGPTRPQDRIAPSDARRRIGAAARRAGAAERSTCNAVAIAAITSCTNTSDPRLLVAAGLARAQGAAPGVEAAVLGEDLAGPRLAGGGDLSARAPGCWRDLEALGFGIVGYGCTTCIGNSGPLPDAMRAAMAQGAHRWRCSRAIATSRAACIRAGAGFLMSPPLVVAYALAGDAERDIEPSGAPPPLVM